MYDPDKTEETFDLKHDKGMMARYKRINQSKEIDLITPIFTDLAQQGKLLLPGVDVRISLIENSNKFRLNTVDDKRDYKFVITKTWFVHDL